MKNINFIKYFIVILLTIITNNSFAKYPECGMLNFFVRVGLNYHLKSPSLDAELINKAGKNYLKMLDSQSIFLTKQEYDTLVKAIDKKSEQYLDMYFSKNCEMFKSLESAVAKGEIRYLKIAKIAAKLTPKKFKLKSLDDRFKNEKELETYITKTIRNDLFENKHLTASNLKNNYLTKKPFINNADFKEQKTAFIIKSFYRACDPHSDYLTESESEQFKELINGQMIGIGVSYTVDNIGVKILSVIKNSPADATGKFEVNDHIIAIDGEKITTNNVSVFSEKLSKPSGTKVKFDVVSAKNEKKIITVTIGKIPEAETKVSSSLKNIDGKKILVIKIPSFYYDYEKKSGTSHDFLVEYEKHKEKIDYIVMDLRNNTGGLLEEAVDLSGLFLGPEVVIYTKSQGIINANQSTVEDIKIKEPLIIIINKLSASASEIVAGALKDYNKAIIVGDESSYGKGTVQTIISHPKSENLGMIKITISQFYLPKGASTQVKGVSSDIVVPGPLNSSKMNEGNNSYALDWDQIETPLKFTYFEKDAKKQAIKEASALSKKRINEMKDFEKKQIEENQTSDLVLEETLNITKDLISFKLKNEIDK